MTLLVLALTGSPTSAGAVTAVSVTAFVAAKLPAGWLADHADRRRLLITCDAAAAVATLAIGLLALTGTVTIATLLVLGALLGASMATRGVADTAALPHLVPPTQLSRAAAAAQVRVYAAGLAGPPLGGALFAAAAPLPFLVDAASFLVAAGSVVRIRGRLAARGGVEGRHRLGAPGPRTAGPVRRPAVTVTISADGSPEAYESRHVDGSGAAPLRAVRDGLAAFWRQPFIRATALLAAASDFVVNAMLLVVVVAATDRGAPPAAVGLLLAAGSAGGLAGAGLATAVRRWATRPVTLLVGAPLLSAVAVGLVGLPSLPAMAGGYALLFLAWPAWNAIITVRWLTLVPDTVRGRVQAAAGLVVSVPSALAPVASGLLLGWLGTAGTCAALASALLVVSIAAAVGGRIDA